MRDVLDFKWILSLGGYNSNICKEVNKERKMYNLISNKRLNNNSQLRLDSHGEQQLLFSLVHIILC